MVAQGYPLPAFYFRVVFDGDDSTDVSFQDVSGITSEMDLEELVEGGENRFVLSLPKGVKHPKLVLKRGIAESSSMLVGWCKDVLESDLNAAIRTRAVDVYLLNEEGTPVRAWSLTGAFPVNWEVENFNSTKNDVAIEKIELSYNTSTRTR